MSDIDWQTIQLTSSKVLSSNSVATSTLVTDAYIIIAVDVENSIHVFSRHDIDNNAATVLKDHTGAVWNLASTGDRLISGSSDANIKIWDLEDGYDFPPPPTHVSLHPLN